MRRLAMALPCGGAVAFWFSGAWWGILLGLLVAYGVERLLSRQEPAAVRAAREQADADLPLAADLLAAALRSGAPVERAVAAVAEALPGPLGDRLDRVARSLRLGADPPEAWAHLAGSGPRAVAGGLRTSLNGRPADRVSGSRSPVDRVIAAAVRSSVSGAALAGALTRLAGELRADRAIAAAAAARRAGVLVVLPLGLCFLPAFLLAGLVPVVLAMLDDVL